MDLGDSYKADKELLKQLQANEHGVVAAAALVTSDQLTEAIDIIIESLRENDWEDVVRIETPLGVHGVIYGIDDCNEEYACIGMVIGASKSEPRVYVEIEGGTYGEMQAFRIYREDLLS